ncbi:MAG: FHA domain-containing protein [Verrucomicrobiota bacterium]
MPRLILQTHEFAGQTFELNDPKISIGRTPDNQIDIADASISSYHGELRLEGGDYKLVDFNSTNGTRINDERISEAILRNNDIVMLGNVMIRYESENVLSAPPAPEQQTASPPVGVASTRPVSFRNLAPFPKKTDDKTGVPPALVFSIILMLGALGWCSYKLFIA